MLQFSDTASFLIQWILIPQTKLECQQAGHTLLEQADVTWASQIQQLSA